VFASPGYFATLGVPLLAGRDVTWAETLDAAPVALVSKGLALEYWGTPAEAIGRRLRISATDDWRQIIGVVGDVHDAGRDRAPRPTVSGRTLVPGFQGRPVRVQRSVTFVVRSPLAGTSGLMDPARRAVWSVDANLPLANVFTLNVFY